MWGYYTYSYTTPLFGVNPWRLMTWLGHKRIDETMRYVHVADGHRRDLPPDALADGNTNKAHESLVGFQILRGGVDGT